MKKQELRGWFSACRIVPVAAVCLGLVACASSPPPAADTPAADTREAEAKLADAVASEGLVTDAEVLQAAIDAGYELRYKDGEKIYCRREAIFGTRVKERIVCLTADEIRALSDDARDYMDDITRRQIPKSGG